MSEYDRPIVVVCAICWQEWDPRDPAVQYRSLDRKWWCADETACTARRARHEAVLDAALDDMKGHPDAPQP